ncbi:MAG: hypothetical protein ACRBC3_00200 [Burkholderiaceae bacterium]
MNFSVALSGLNAATRRMDEAAVEISRAGIPPSQRSAESVPAEATPVGAVPDNTAVAGLPDPDLPGAMVSQIAASAAFMANVQSLRRTDDNMEALLKLR